MFEFTQVITPRHYLYNIELIRIVKNSSTLARHSAGNRVCQGWSGVRGATLLVTHPRWEPYAGKPLVRFCAGAIRDGRAYRVSYSRLAKLTRDALWF